MIEQKPFALNLRELYLQFEEVVKDTQKLYGYSKTKSTEIVKRYLLKRRRK